MVEDEKKQKKEKAYIDKAMKIEKTRKYKEKESKAIIKKIAEEFESSRQRHNELLKQIEINQFQSKEKINMKLYKNPSLSVFK